MKKIIGFIFIFIAFLSSGQQLTQYSQWSYNQFSINPALAGVKKCLEIRTAARAQWLGYKGAPISGMITVNAPLHKRQRRYNDFFHGIGGKVQQDMFGPFRNLELDLAYALHFPLGKQGKQLLSFGVSLGVGQFGFDGSQATVIHPDPAVYQSTNQLLFPVLSFGGFYYSKNYYIGLSVDQLARNKWKGVGFASRFRLHTKFSGGARFTFSNNNSLLPGLLLRIPPAGPISLDLNVMFDFKNKFTLGVGYRNTDAVIGFVKVNIGAFTIGYSFDYITSSIRGGNYHTHEISIQFSGCRHHHRSADACPLFE